LLLLERQADMSGGWWQTVFGCGDGDARAVQRLLEPAQPVVLPPIERAEDRRRIIADILRRSGSVVHPPEAGEAPEFDHQLTSLTWGGEPLFLMMAGLRAAEVGFGAVLTLSRDDLALSIADRELDRIGRVAQRHAVPREFACHMAAVVTVSQGLSRDRALAAIEQEKIALHRQQAGDDATVYEALLDALSHRETEIECGAARHGRRGFAAAHLAGRSRHGARAPRSGGADASRSANSNSRVSGLRDPWSRRASCVAGRLGRRGGAGPASFTRVVG
jgi:hypothetical protein